jgi:hypothetical protein
MLGRAAAVYTPFERCLLGVAVLLGLVAVRDWTFASLLVAMFAPVGFDRAVRKRPARRAPAVGGVIALAAAAAAIAAAVGALRAPAANLTPNYPAAAGDRAAQAAARHPGGVVYAGIPFADWLLWAHPSLAGRVVFDVRYELLHADEVKRLVLFDAGSGVYRPVGAPVAYVLDPEAEKQAVSALRPDVRAVYDTDHAFVAVARK